MRVLLAQTQKPPTENRIFHKLGKSLAEIPGFKVEILGSNLHDEGSEKSDQISLKPIFAHKFGWRQALNRWLRFWTQLSLSNPDIVIICSPDLLPVGLLYKWLFGKILIWDMQENYQLNVQHQLSFNDRFQSFKVKMANWITRISIWFSDQVWLAEKIYQNQLPQKVRIKTVILENKVAVDWANPLGSYLTINPYPYFLFSGVITEESGVLTAIEWMESWTNRFPEWKLKLCGYCPNDNLRKQLEHLKINKNWLQFDRLNNWKSDMEIRSHLLNCAAILMPYRESEANRNKRPTKWFEAIWANKAALVQKNGHWDGFENCLAVNYDQPKSNSFDTILESINGKPVSKMAKENSYFDSALLKREVEKLISKPSTYEI